MTSETNGQFKRIVPTSPALWGERLGGERLGSVSKRAEALLNVKATLSPDDLARACAEAMWKDDDASQGLGMEIVEIKPGQATLKMTVQPHMVNGQRIAHGGFIFALADSAFAFACNTHNERASRDEIIALQIKRLAWSLSHAYENVAHYKKAFDNAGVHPSDFKALADLSKFPFTKKTDLRDNYPFNMFAVAREKVVRVHASSGTTGKPIVVGYTRGDIDIWADVMARSIRAAGGRTGMIIHNAYGYGLFTGGLGVHYGAGK